MPVASANPIVWPWAFAVELFLINFPVDGLLLVLVFSLYIWLGGVPKAIGPGANATMLLLGTVIITGSGALIDTFVWALLNEILHIGVLVLVTLGVLVGLVAALVARWFLDMSWSASVVVGAAFCLLNITIWLVFEMVDTSLEAVYAVTTVLYGVFAGALLLESLTWHRRRGFEEPSTGEMVVVAEDVADLAWFGDKVVQASVVALMYFLFVIFFDVAAS